MQTTKPSKKTRRKVELCAFLLIHATAFTGFYTLSRNVADAVTRTSSLAFLFTVLKKHHDDAEAEEISEEMPHEEGRLLSAGILPELEGKSEEGHNPHFKP